MGPRRGVAAWGRAGAQRGVVQGRSSMGPRRGGGGTACTLGGGGGELWAGGARTPLGGDESRRESSTGANPSGSGGERHAVPSRPNRTTTGPAGGIPGGRAGLGTGAPGPGSLVVVGRHRGDRAGLSPAEREGGRGRAGRARGRTPRGPKGPGEGSRGRPFLEGGGGVAPFPGCAGAQRGAVQGRSRVGRRRGAAVCGRAGVQQCGATQGCSGRPRRSAAWGRVWARHGAAHGRGAGLRRGAVWGCGGARRGAAYGRGIGPRRGAARGRAGVQRGAAEERGMGPRMGAAWGRAGARRGAAQGCSVGPRRSAAWGRV